MGFGKDGKGVIIREQSTITLGGLAAGVAVKGISEVALETTSFRIIKMEYFISQSGAFGAEGDEALIGFANDVLSVTEIAASLTVDGPKDRNDTPGRNTAEFAVWLLAQLKEPTDATTGYDRPLNMGRPMEKVLRWTFTPPEGWTWFAYNPLAGALTTGAVFRIHAKYYGVWVD